MYKVARLICLVTFVFMIGSGAAHAKGDTLVIANPADAKTLDPHGTPESTSHSVMRQIYESLITHDKDMNIIPWLAEKWEVVDNGKGYKFYLKKGVKFHNGEEMKADDVIFSFKRALGPDGGAVRALANSIDPDGFEKVDDYTVIVRTKQPMGTVFLASMIHPWSSILNKKAVEAAGKDYGMNPVGTGRFKYERWSRGDSIYLQRFEEYHAEKAKLNKMIFRAVIEPNSRTIELESGAVDLAVDPQVTDFKRLMDRPDMKVVTKPGQLIFHLGLNLTKAPYDNIKVREAMNLAVNRAGITKAIFHGFAEVPNGPTTVAVKYNKAKETPTIKPDIKKAKQLLAEAGYPNGFKGKILTADRPVYINVATVVQENLSQIGIQMEISIFEWGTYIDAMKKQDHDPYVYAWWGGAPALDPYFFLNTQFHSVALGQTNLVFMNDKELDALLDEGARLMDGPERAEVYGKAWDIINAKLPWIYLAAANRNFAMTKTLEGIDFTPSQVNYFGNAYFTDKK